MALIVTLIALGVASLTHAQPQGANLAALAPAAGPTPRTFTMVADLWCPYNCAEDAPRQGFMVDETRAALEPLGFKVVYQVMPWQRAVEAVRQGTADALIAATPPENPELLYPTTSWPCGYTVYGRADNPTVYTGPASLGNQRLGYVAGYVYGPAEDAYIAANKGDKLKVQALYGEDTIGRQIQKLLTHRIDVFIDNQAVTEYYLQKNHITTPLKVLGSVGSEAANRCYLGLSPAKPDMPAIIKLLDARLKALQIDAIHQHYGLTQSH